MLCRSIENRTVLMKRCKDAANDGRGYMIVLDDGDIIKLLELVGGGRRREISQYLQGYWLCSALM